MVANITHVVGRL